MDNLLEIRRGIVHADSGDGLDYTLCGVTAERLISDMSEYDKDDETPYEPLMIRTDRKIDCPKCAATILYCCSLGKKSISKNLKEENAV